MAVPLEQTKHGHKHPKPNLGSRTTGQVKLQATDQPQQPQVMDGQINLETYSIELWMFLGGWRQGKSRYSGNYCICPFVTYLKS